MTEIEEAIKYYAQHPYEYVVDWLGTKPTTQQKAVLDILPTAIRDRKGVAVKSGHGTGKTAMQAWCIKWFMDTKPMPKIISTAPTQHQLYDVVWAELAKWHKQSFTKDSTSWTKTAFTDKTFPENWFAVARTSNKPENMQGFHAENLLFLVDEASGVATEVLEVIEGTQTQEGALILLFGNPTQVSGAFYDAFNSKRKFYLTYTFNSETSEIVLPAYYEKIAAKYGKDSDIYRVRVLGEFPKAEPDTLISLDKVEAAALREIDRNLSLHEVIELGVDVARFGDDECTCYSRLGNTIKEEFILQKSDIMEIANRIALVVKDWQNIKSVIVNVDDTGMGGGVTDRLKEMVELGEIYCEVVGVNNGAAAVDSSLYSNLGTEMWFFMRDKIIELDIPNDNDLIGQLSTRKHKFIGGKNALEKKEDMKHRGLTSPDRADGCILTLRSLIYQQADTSSMSYAC